MYTFQEMADQKNELSSAEIRDVIFQARDLGARKIVILGGEPLTYPRIMEKIEFIHSLGLQVELFTNGLHLTRGEDCRLFDLGVNVVLKDQFFQRRCSRQAGWCSGIF